MGAADNAVLPAARNPPSKRHCGQHISLDDTKKGVTENPCILQKE